MPHSENHRNQLALAATDPHAANLLNKIAHLEEEISTATQHTLVWDDISKQLKKQKLHLRDALESAARKN